MSKSHPSSADCPAQQRCQLGALWPSHRLLETQECLHSKDEDGSKRELGEDDRTRAKNRFFEGEGEGI